MSSLITLWLFLIMSFGGQMKPDMDTPPKPGYTAPTGHQNSIDIVDIERNSGGSNYFFKHQ